MGVHRHDHDHVEPTADPTCVITARGDGWIEYRSDDGTTWRITGVCNRCGSCEIAGGADSPPWILWLGEPGTPGACVDLRDRLDSPVRPEGPPRWPGCTLVGEYR